MCIQCHKKYGSPKILNDKIKQCAKFISDLYDYHCCGGHLHIVVDDWNLEDNFLDSCKKDIDKNEYNYCKEQLHIENLIYTLMKNMTIDERASMMAYSGYGENFI